MAVDFNLYLITDRKQTRLSLPEAIRLTLKGGVRAIQLREKDLPVRELLALAREVRDITREFKARLFVNDRIDVAVAVDADGIHLGHQSMPVGAARKIVGSRMLIGASTHTLNEALEAEQGGADLITFGPVFVTPSKVRYGDPIGLEALKDVKEHVRIPVFGLGGIKQGNMREVMKCGADGIAMISAIVAAENIQSAAEDIVNALSIARRA